ncbi:MAG: Capsular polysaccharide export system periplasmic protein KpsD [uncultured Sulfurovum sp.]|uniref:Capsular polysaccharide export system periplasmic protein KpsD n=1 Tax=uncultured Sulfurovum sp. TaxID=269237 RepID=A0A6S6UEJ1_9BACT|nr:MAG: Capsular polysaccharide export system periplasmic protein KpsD [uncultured Sulfurovum sp.]
MKKNKFMVILLLLLLSNFAFAVEFSIEQNSTENSRLTDTTKAYFGEKIFKGNFKENKQFRYNPNYLINIGDVVSVKIWGAYEFLADLTVDQQGNIFVPKVGAIRLLGLPLSQLKSKIQSSIKKIFNDNVYVYADVKQYQLISVFVSGGVQKVGLYNGLSTDSILQFIDKSGGIIRGQGSFRNINILRNKQIIRNVDLYQFLIDGQVDSFQFKNGDVILVNPVQNFIEVEGDVNRPYIFELLSLQTSVEEVMRFIMLKPTANSFMLTAWDNGQETTTTYKLNQSVNTYVVNGSKLKFFSDYYVNNIEINIEGEHKGSKNLTVKKGTTLYDILSKIEFTPLSEIKNVRIYRKSVASIQKQLLETMLKDLEARTLTSDSSTVEEASIRNKESELVMNFVKRAREVEPLGQVVISNTDDLDKIYLENGDRVVIPKRSNIVVIQGEVNIPNAIAYRENYDINDYISVCGGYGDRADREKVLLLKANGEVSKYNTDDFFGRAVSPRVEAGDSILVLGKTDSKDILITSSVTTILYQIAVGAAVVLRAF